MAAVNLPFAYSLVGGAGDGSEPFGFYDEPVGTIGDDLLVTLRFPLAGNGVNLALHRIGNTGVDTIATATGHTASTTWWAYGHNDSGTAVIITTPSSATNYELLVVTPDGAGGMTVTHSTHTSASWALSPADIYQYENRVLVAQDGQAFALNRPGGAVYVFDIDGTPAYTIAASATKQAVALMTVDRWLQLDYTTTPAVTGGYDQYLRLMDDTNTTLDSDTVVYSRSTAYSASWQPAVNTAGIGGLYFKGSGSNGVQYAVAIPTDAWGTTIDFEHRHYSCAGDVLTRSYTTATDTTTSWNADYLATMPTTWNGVTALIQRAQGSSITASVLWIDSAGTFVESDTYTSPAYLSDQQVQVGATALAAFVYYSQEDWYFWRAPTTVGPTYLRQRQSPRRTPSRVRGVDLRQRQTTRIA